MKRRCFTQSVAVAAAVAASQFALTPGLLHAQVVLDGSLGHAGGALAGPNFMVPATVGRLVGGNLFHSFQTLNLAAGESATFTGPDTVTRVLTRVTGGSPSNIEGTLRCTIPNADFYLVNPAGVVFGPDASLDVQGSFTVTTADVVKLVGGGKFAASTTSANSVLTSAAPAAFGFLTPHPVGIAINGSALAVKPEKSLTLVAGRLQITGGTLTAPGGRLDVAATAVVGDVTLASATNSDAGPSLPDPTAGGAITLEEDSSIDTSGEGGGRINIRGGDLDLDTSLLLARTTGAIDGRGIDVLLSGDFTFVDGGIDTTTLAAGKGGSVHIAATSLAMSGDPDGVPNGVRVQAGINATGRGGDILLDVSILSLDDGQFLSTTTFGTAPGGSVNVQANEVIVSGANDTDATQTGISSGTTAIINGGAAGSILIQANNMIVRDGALVRSNTSGSGMAGTLDVAVRDLIIDGINSDFTTGLSSNSNATATGAAGSVAVRAGTVTLKDGGQIRSDTFGSGSAGDVIVDANQITIDGTNSDSFTGISSESILETAGGGAAGGVSVRADSLSIIGGAFISSNTAGTGAGGTLAVSAERLSIAGISDFNSGVSADSSSPLSTGGKSGDVRVRAGIIEMANGAEISSDTSGGPGGSVDVIAREIRISNDPSSEFPTFISADSLEGAEGAAGNVNVAADSIELTAGSQITSDARGLGNAGKVTVEATSMLHLDGAGGTVFNGISSDANPGATGNAGTVTVRGGQIDVIGGSQISSATSGPGNAGAVTLEATSGIRMDRAGGTSSNGISSAANPGATGNAGTVTVRGGQIDVIGGSQISSATSGPGNAGAVTVEASSALHLDRAGGTFFNGISSQAGSGSTGDAGSVFLHAGEIDIISGSQVSSSTFGPGNAGTVSVRAGQIDVLGSSEIGSNTHGSGDAGAVTLEATSGIRLDRAGGTSFNGISSDAIVGSTGNAGTVTVRGGQIDVIGGSQISSTTFGPGDAGTVTVEASSGIQLNGAAGPFFNGISSNANAGSTGNAGSVVVRAGQIDVLGGSQISSGTSGPGDAGTVTVEASSGIQLNGAGGLFFNGISSDANPGSTGNAGSVVVRAGQIDVLGGSQISSGTSGLGNAGSITVEASSGLHLDSAGGTSFNGIASNANSGSTGNAGFVKFRAPLIEVLGESNISSSTFSSGAAGDLEIVASRIRLVGANNSGGIFSTAASSSSGDAGSIHLEADELDVQNGAFISVSTSSIGAGGSLDITAGKLIIDADGADETGLFAATRGKTGAGRGGNLGLNVGEATLTGKSAKISSDSEGDGIGGTLTLSGNSFKLTGGAKIESTATGSGPAGSVNVRLGRLTLESGATISGTTTASGIGGRLDVAADQLVIDGTGGLPTGLFVETTSLNANAGAAGEVFAGARSIELNGTGAAISGRTSGAGVGGTVRLRGESVRLGGGAIVTAQSTGTGPGGSVEIDAQNLLVADNAGIEASCTGLGNAGGVSVSAARDVQIENGGFIATSAMLANGGPVNIRTGHDVRITHGSVSAKADVGNAGDIELTAPHLVELADGAAITTKAGSSGGNVVIDPEFIVVRGSSIVADAVQKNAGNITLDGGQFLRSGSVISASSTFGLSGDINITSPDVDIAGSLTRLPDGFADASAVLQGQCGARLTGTVSSFISTGRGGAPMSPGGWAADVRLARPQ